MLPLHNEQFKQKYTNLCFNRYYETPSKSKILFIKYTKRAEDRLGALRLFYESLIIFVGQPMVHLPHFMQSGCR